MNKKAFTLIELLGVLVLIGIIMLIAIPNISNIIRSSRDNTIKQSAINIKKAGTNYFRNNPYISPMDNSKSKVLNIELLKENNYISKTTNLNGVFFKVFIAEDVDVVEVLYEKNNNIESTIEDFSFDKCIKYKEVFNVNTSIQNYEMYRTYFRVKGCINF